MARSKIFLRTRDIDWAVDIGGCYVHVSSAGGDLPAIVEEKLFDVWRVLKEAEIVCEEDDVELNEAYLSEKFNAADNEDVRPINLKREWYLHSFKAMAMRGFYSFDRDIRTPFEESEYRLVAKPGNMTKRPKFDLPLVNIEKSPEELDGVDIVKMIDERVNR